MYLDVISSPSEIAIALAQAPGAACAVIDVVRATTTLVVLGEGHLAGAYVVGSVAEARALAQTRPGILLAGEVQARPPAGFDLGNSPAEIARATIAGRQLVLTTTNGTRALLAAQQAGAGEISVAALRNASAVARHLLALAGNAAGAVTTFCLLCAGSVGRTAVDDLYTAGVIVRRALELAEDTSMLRLTENAQIAYHLALRARDPLALLTTSNAGRSVIAAGLGEDLAWCATIDATTIVPRVVSGPDGSLMITYGQP